MKKVLVTGGAGYIGSHTVVQLIGSGYEPVIVDNFSNSNPKVLTRIEQISGQKPVIYNIDLRDRAALKNVFAENDFYGVIHFAGLKSVGESVELPLSYFDNNLGSTFTLLSLMQEHDVKRLIFSSSATVYGDPDSCPIPESARLQVTNPYGRTKLMIEEMLQDISVSKPDWSIASLRYFNPIGAHESGLIGEDPNGTPNNLLPFICRVAVGRIPELKIYGNDYPTPDGTGVRDYIHVLDLADAHIKALEKLPTGYSAYNVGTGKGTSVIELLQAFENASNLTVPHSFVERRPGDIAECYADPSKARTELGWQATRDIDQACADAWRWQSQNPNGFNSVSSS